MTLFCAATRASPDHVFMFCLIFFFPKLSLLGDHSSSLLSCKNSLIEGIANLISRTIFPIQFQSQFVLDELAVSEGGILETVEQVRGKDVKEA